MALFWGFVKIFLTFVNELVGYLQALYICGVITNFKNQIK